MNDTILAAKGLKIITSLGTALKSFDSRDSGVSYVVNTIRDEFETKEELILVFNILAKSLEDKDGVDIFVDVFRSCPIASSSGILWDIDEVLKKWQGTPPQTLVTEANYDELIIISTTAMVNLILSSNEMNIKKFIEDIKPLTARLSKISNEMTDYYRHKDIWWQDSEDGTTLSDCLDKLDNIIMLLDEIQDNLTEQFKLNE